MITVVNKSDKVAKFCAEGVEGVSCEYVLEPGKTCQVPAYMLAGPVGKSILSMLTGGRVVKQEAKAAPVAESVAQAEAPVKQDKKGK